MFTAKRILTEIAGPERRQAILAAFWRHAETTTRLIAQAQLARALKFREETIRKMAPEKKAGLLASRIGLPEFDDYLEIALMQFHTHERVPLMSALLDLWNIPHENGSIETERLHSTDRRSGS